MKTRLLFGLVGIALMSNVACAKDRFDLVCRVDEYIVDQGGPRTIDDTKRYRIDLSSHQWCSDPCLDGSRAIAQITPSTLVLDDWYYGDGSFGISIDRISGRLRGHMTSMGANWYTDLITGLCDTRPFTPPPSASQKF